MLRLGDGPTVTQAGHALPMGTPGGSRSLHALPWIFPVRRISILMLVMEFHVVSELVNHLEGS